jgi:hypothetical protein
MRKAHYFIPLVTTFSLFVMIGCNETTNQKDSNISDTTEKLDTVLKEPVIAEKQDSIAPDINASDRVSVKLFQKKIKLFPEDSIISYQIKRATDKNCSNWQIPPKSDLIKIITTFYEISGNEWNGCYGDWNCGIEGQMVFQSKKYNYRLDAGGWIILFNKKEQRYFGCKNPDCKKYFPSDCFCNEDGIIDQ